MDAGGKFILLLPNTEQVKRFLLKIRKTIDEFFIKRFKGILTLSVAWRETKEEEELLLKNFSYTLDDLNQLLEEQKKKKLFTYLVDVGSIIEFDYDEFSKKGPCSICGIHPAKEENICESCSDQKKIGAQLPRTRYLAFNRTAGIPLFSNLKVLLKEDDNFFSNEMDFIYGIRDNAQKYTTMWLAGYLPKIQNEDLLEEEFLKKAMEELEEEEKKDLVGEPKTLELISYKALKREGDEIFGRNLLCVLKADVDNLGLIFSIGLEDRLSLSRYASLSRMLNAFFSGYLVEKIRNEPRYKDVYVVFAGGDDLFLIGPWHHTIDFAQDLREEFRRFCANNEDMSMSCGLYIMKPKYPVRRAAREAERLLDMAKERKEGHVVVKDGVCVFDVVLSWKELKEQVEFGKWLEQRALDESSKMNRAFIYRLLGYMRFAKKYEQASEINLEDLMFYPHALYDISRNLIKTDEKNEIINSEEVKYILDRIDLFKQDRLGVNTVAIQYALCAIRR